MGVDEKWLVKSNDQVIGPIEFDHVVENIFSGEYHLLDEIKGPFERWRPIKDHSLFAAAIERLKATTYNPREQTVTLAHDSATHTVEMNQGDTISKTHEITATPYESQHSSKSIPSEVQPTSQERQYAAPPLGSQSQGKQRGSGISLLIVAVLLLLGGGYLFVEYQKAKQSEARLTNYDQLTDKGIAALQVGDYQDALRSFSRAAQIVTDDPNLLLEMAPLSVQFDGKFSQVEMSISQLLATNHSKVFVKKGKNIIGLTHSYRGNHEAAVTFYNQAISSDANFLAPKINKAFSLIKTGKMQQASDLMAKTIPQFPGSATAQYMYIRSLVEWALAKKDPKIAREALSVASQFPQKFSDLKQEVLFLMTLAHMSLKLNEKGLRSAVRSFLSVDSELTPLHIRDTSVDLQAFHWLGLANHCNQLVSRLDQYTGRLLEGHCLLKINRTIEAKRIFEELLSKNNKDGLLQALFASSLLQLNESAEAKNTLGFLKQVKPIEPLLETNLRGCLIHNDRECERSIFEGPYSNQISLLYSHWGNSQIYLDQNPKKASRSIRLGLEISPNFAPLLKLKRNL